MFLDISLYLHFFYFRTVAGALTVVGSGSRNSCSLDPHVFILPPLSPFFFHFLRFRVRDDVFSFLAAGGKPTPEHGMFFCRLAEIKSEVGINYIYISIYIYIFIHSSFPILSSFRSDFSPPFLFLVGFGQVADYTRLLCPFCFYPSIYYRGYVWQ